MNKFSILIFISLLVCTTRIAADDFDFAQPDSEMCYFPMEFQGIYVIQVKNNEPGSKVTYSEVPVEADGIPPWGRCFKRKGNQVIFKDTNGAQNCIRCFHLTLKSPNVIQILTEGLQKCYITEEAARATCPSEKDIREKRYKEYTLFRKHVPGGLQTTENVFCPFNGRYQFIYKTERKQISCDGGSELSNCPHGNALGLRFGQCKTKTTASVSLDKRFLCLGSWDHFDSNSQDKFLALMDMNEDPVDRPKYRCGLYREESDGRINVALSSDSTCTNYLLNSTSGYETFQMTPIIHKTELNQLDNMKCKFPDWSQGKWALTKIDGQTFQYKDSKNQFRQLNSRCLMRQQNNFGHTSREDRFLVHTVTQCGDEMFQCIWLKYRGPNIYEFMIGKTSSRNASIKLCDDNEFEDQTWITQARNVAKQTTGCPIVGDYSGVVPGESSLCAKIASDCNNPDIMFYTVSLCANKSHIFEQREYKCFGSWEEDGALLTFTQRRDMPGYQCFRGNIKRNGDEAFIAEIGESCIRGDDPTVNEMKITKQANCQRTPTANYVPVLSWDSKAIDKVPNQIPKRVQTINGRHNHDQIQNNNLPSSLNNNLNTNNYNLNNNQRYGDLQTTNNHLNTLHNTDSNQIYPISTVSNRPQINIINNDNYYQAEQPIIKRKMITNKRPTRIPPYLNHNSSSSFLLINYNLIILISLLTIISQFRKLI